MACCSRSRPQWLRPYRAKRATALSSSAGQRCKDRTQGSVKARGSRLASLGNCGRFAALRLQKPSHIGTNPTKTRQDNVSAANLVATLGGKAVIRSRQAASNFATRCRDGINPVTGRASWKPRVLRPAFPQSGRNATSKFTKRSAAIALRAYERKTVFHSHRIGRACYGAQGRTPLA